MDKKLPHIAVIGLKGIPAIGGTASVGENIVKALSDKFDFTIYATSSHAFDKKPFTNVRQFIFKKILPHKLNVFYYNLMSVLHALIFCKYDLIHTHQIDTGFVVPLLRLRYKVIATHHGRTYQMSKWSSAMKLFFRLTERLMIRFANKVSFVAESERMKAELKYGGQYLTINNGIDLNQAIKNVDKKHSYIMFAAGRIVPHKGCHVFLEALLSLNYQGEILIAGDYHQINSYQLELESYRDDLNIRFLGMLQDKSELLGYAKNARFFVFPSFYEAMSMMLLEVTLVKTPLICSDIVENKAVFNDDEVEYFKVGDVEDLASKINKYLDNELVSKLKAEKAYERLIDLYQWKDIALEYAKIYNLMIKAHD